MLELAVRRCYRFVREDKPLLELRRVTLALRGELHPERQSRVMVDALATGVATFAPHVGVSELDLRLGLHMFTGTVIRLARLSDGEREVLVGATG